MQRGAEYNFKGFLDSLVTGANLKEKTVDGRGLVLGYYSFLLSLSFSDELSGCTFLYAKHEVEFVNIDC